MADDGGTSHPLSLMFVSRGLIGRARLPRPRTISNAALSTPAVDIHAAPDVSGANSWIKERLCPAVGSFVEGGPTRREKMKNLTMAVGAFAVLFGPFLCQASGTPSYGTPRQDKLAGHIEKVAPALTVISADTAISVAQSNPQRSGSETSGNTTGSAGRAPNSGAGVQGLPGNKSGPAVTPSGQVSAQPKTTPPDQSGVPGLPGSKSGPAARPK